MLKNRILLTLTAVALGLGMGWVAAAQEDQRKWGGKDGGREEYDLYDKANNADANTRIAALDEWKQRFPDSDFKDLRENAYLITYQQLGDCRNSFDWAVTIRKRVPNDFLSNSSILRCVVTFMPPAEADLAAAEEVANYLMANADAAFAAANKPAGLDDAQWAAARPEMLKLAQRTVAWVYVQRKDDARAVTEITKVLRDQPERAEFSFYIAQALMNQRTEQNQDQIIPQAIFHYARAGNFTGETALPEAQRNQFRDYAQNLYKQYHGEDNPEQEEEYGSYDDIIQLVSASALPPSNFEIWSRQGIVQDEFEKEQAWAAANPDWDLWNRAVFTPLSGGEGLPDGTTPEMYFAEFMKDALLPGRAGQTAEHPFKFFRATIISMTPEEGQPEQLTVAIGDPERIDATVANATLMIDGNLPDDLMLMPGQTIYFDGVPDEFAPEPFMLTFKVDLENGGEVSLTPGEVEPLEEEAPPEEPAI